MSRSTAVATSSSLGYTAALLLLHSLGSRAPPHRASVLMLRLRRPLRRTIMRLVHISPLLAQHRICLVLYIAMPLLRHSSHLRRTPVALRLGTLLRHILVRLRLQERPCIRLLVQACRGPRSMGQAGTHLRQGWTMESCQLPHPPLSMLRHTASQYR